MIVKIFQKIIAKITTSKLILHNPYMDIVKIENQLNFMKSESCSNQVILGKNSKFYKTAEVYNIQNNNEKITIGNNTHVRGILLVFGYGGKISIGNDSFIGSGTQIWSSNEVKIGNSVLISHNCNIIDTNSHEENYIERHNTYIDMLKNGHSKTIKNINSAQIVIEDNVWINFNAIILKGVTIGKGAIIGAGSIISKNVEPFTVVYSNQNLISKKID